MASIRLGNVTLRRCPTGNVEISEDSQGTVRIEHADLPEVVKVLTEWSKKNGRSRTRADTEKEDD